MERILELESELQDNLLDLAGEPMVLRCLGQMHLRSLPICTPAVQAAYLRRTGDYIQQYTQEICLLSNYLIQQLQPEQLKGDS